MSEEINVKILPLNNGIVLMGELLVSSEKDSSYVFIKRPVSIEQVPMSQSVHNSVTFSPFLPFTTQFEIGIPISVNEIMSVCTPIDPLRDKYLEIISKVIRPASGIVRP